jgi:hypothetical protein
MDDVLWTGIPGWPVLDDGLLMAYIEDVMFIRIASDVTDRVFDRHLKELARSIDLRPVRLRVGVVYDAMGRVDVSAERRQSIANLLLSRRDKLAATTAAFALATDAAVMRGVLRAVFWLAPPPYPWAIRGSVREALEYVRTEMPKLDVDRVLRGYERVASPSSGARHPGDGPGDGRARQVS